MSIGAARTGRTTPLVPAARLLVAAAGLLAATACAAPSLRAQATEESCVTCHLLLDESLSSPVKRFAEDIHAARGFGCVSCHGGDATVVGPEAMDPARGYIGKPERQEIVQLCGRCHSDARFMRQFDPSLRVDQVVEYQTSVHGRRLMEFDDPNVATCASCHTPHSIKPPSDPNSSVHPLRVSETCGSCHADPERMEPYGIATDQLDRYSQSLHWEMLSVEGDLSAPTCNDCHGNHGAAPPGISWVGNVCGGCHSVIAELFDGSFHSQFLTLLGMPGCATCHNNHDIRRTSDELLGLGDDAVCARCHSDESKGGEVAVAMRSFIDSLGTAFEAADSILSRAENAGMEVSQAQFELNDALSARVRARNAVHTFSVDAVAEEVESGLEVTRAAHERGSAALAELRFRRTGLAVSALIILALIVGIVLTIRATEERVTASVDTITGFFFESMVAAKEGQRVPVAPEELRLAACAVLLELAHADDQFTESERRHIEDLIRRTFDLEEAQAQKLIELAEEQRAEPKHIARFTSLIARSYTTEEKVTLVKDMWGLVLSDGELASREQYLIHRIARLLGLDVGAIAAARTKLEQTTGRDAGEGRS